MRVGGKLLSGFFDDTGGGVKACVDFGKYVPHNSGKCVSGVAKFLLATAY